MASSEPVSLRKIWVVATQMSPDYESAGYIGWHSRKDAEYYLKIVIDDLLDIMPASYHRVRLATPPEIKQLWVSDMTEEEHRNDDSGSSTQEGS